MNIKTCLAAAGVMTVLAGCSSFNILPDTKKIDYKTAGRAPTLEVPPDLSQISRDDRYSVPGSATYSDFKDRASNKAVENSTVLPRIDNVRVERSGNQRWLVVNLPADKLWGAVKDFWQESGFIIKTENPAAGIMETDWAENRAKIPDDIIRQTLGKLLDSLYSTGERDKFRTRMEPGQQPGTTDIFISHRGAEEVYTSATKDQTRWQPRQADPELEAEMLRRLMVRLGTDEKRAQTAIAGAQSGEERAKLTQMADGSGTVIVQEGFDRAWRRVGLALDRVGFTVEDRDRSKGIYYVRYVDPEADGQKEDKGWFSKLAFWRGGDKGADSRIQYRILVSDAGATASVQILTREGGADKSDTARKILKLLHEQLK